MLRRYWCSDINPIPDRKDEIRTWDIAKGLPEDLPKPQLVFLDPPYWKQAEGRYSDSPQDLGNMTLDQFNDLMNALFQSIKKRKVEQIALVIQPTQYKNDFHWVDHFVDFHQMLSDKYRIDMRYILPYQTQQYLPQMVEKAKKFKKCLCLHRDLVIWQLK